MRVAVLGMGRMGRALASRLLERGHAVTVWNRTPGRADDLLGRGAVEATDPSAVTGRVDAIVSSLSDDRAVTEVLLPGGRPLVDGGPPIVDASTISPATAGRLAAAYGASYVASPILGAPQAVTAGEATYAIAGPEPTVSSLAELWESLSSKRLDCGTEPARAQQVKLVNNYLLLGGLAVLAEAVAAAQGAGFDDAFLATVLRGLPTVAPALANRLDDVVSGDHRGWFTTGYGAKDVGLFADSARDDGVEVPLARAVERRYRDAAEQGYGDADIAAIVELLRS